MPLYEYECKSCESVVEVLVRSQGEQVECPHCGEQKLNRLLSVPAAHSSKSAASLPVAGSGESCGAPALLWRRLPVLGFVSKRSSSLSETRRKPVSERPDDD